MRAAVASAHDRGYPQDGDTIREDVTGNAEADEFFVMDPTTELSLAAQRGDREAVRAILHPGAPIEQRSHIWELPSTRPASVPSWPREPR